MTASLGSVQSIVRTVICDILEHVLKMMPISKLYVRRLKSL